MQGTGKALAHASIVAAAITGAFAAGAAGAAAAAAEPQAQAAAASLAVKRGPALPVPGASDPTGVYDVGEDAEVGCGSGKTALVAGWTGAQAIVSRVRPDSEASGFVVELRRPMKSGRLTPLAVCLGGAPRASVKTGSANGSVSCGTRLAVGVPATSTWPYNLTAVSAGPQGAHGWKTTATNSAGVAICVAPSALGSVSTTTRTARFALGKDAASVAATCRGAARPIGWGYDAPLMEENGWSSADTSSKLLVPFISASQPQGGNGWRLTFRTPDGSGAKSAATVAIRLTCGVPKAGAAIALAQAGQRSRPGGRPDHRGPGSRKEELLERREEMREERREEARREARREAGHERRAAGRGRGRGSGRCATARSSAKGGRGGRRGAKRGRRCGGRRGGRAKGRARGGRQQPGARGGGGKRRARGAALADVSLPKTRATAIVLNRSFAGVKIGQSVAAAMRAWGETGCPEDGLGGVVCIYELRNSSINYNTGNVSFTARAGKVTGFRIRAPWESVKGVQVFTTASRALTRYKTDRGIGLNATTGQLLAAYPKARRTGRSAGTSVYTLAGGRGHRSTFTFSPTPSGTVRLAALTTE